MFRLDDELKVYVHLDAVDFRKSINGLAAIVEQSMEPDPFVRADYVFSNQRHDRIKMLLCDRNGFWLLKNYLASYYNSFTATGLGRLSTRGCYSSPALIYKRNHAAQYFT